MNQSLLEYVLQENTISGFLLKIKNYV